MGVRGYPPREKIEVYFVCVDEVAQKKKKVSES